MTEEFLRMQGVRLDKDRHVYNTADGLTLPSVSEIIRPLTDATYRDIPRDVLYAAQARGTAVHEAIEYRIAYGWQKDVDEQHVPYLSAYSAWEPEAVRQGFTITNSEVMMRHKANLFAGTLDILATHPDHGTCIIDIKTAAELNNRTVAVQVAAYAMMVQSWTDVWPRQFVLHLTKQGEFDFRRLDNRYPDAMDALYALVSLWNYSKKGE